MALSLLEPATAESESAAPLEFAPLSDESIANQTDSGSFSRGRSYFRGQRIFQATRRGNRLRARCYGSSGGPYVVEATLAPAEKPKRNPISYACDCPRGGFCKHVVALLLTWVDRPESFVVRQPIGELLAGKSNDELLALIELLLAADPNLEELIEQPIVLLAADPGSRIDENAIRRQIKDALRDDDFFDGNGRRGRYDPSGDYYAASRIASKLERLVQLAEEAVVTEDYGNALAIAAVLVEETAPHLETISDHDGDLYGLLARSDEMLASCLDAQPGLPAERQLATEARRRLIDAILSLWQVDLDIGGIDISGEGPAAIGRSATSEEQQRVAIWLRQSLRPSSGNPSRTWQNQATIGFLSLLSGEAGLFDEELLTEYRAAEMWDEAAEMLVRLGRHDEAVALAARRLVLPQSLLAFADRLIGTGDAARVKQAIALVDDRLWEQEGQNPHYDRIFGDWLQQRYADYGQPEKALALARDRFAIAPNRATFAAVKTAALLPDQPGDPWPALRPNLIATLRKRGDWFGLIEIHLEDGEVGDALAALEKSGKKGARHTQVGWMYHWPDSVEQYESRVASAAEASFPDEAIRLYLKLAEQKIAGRNRATYQQAAGFLARVKQILEANDRTAEWPPLIGELRTRFKTLRALREELDLLGLA